MKAGFDVVGLPVVNAGGHQLGSVRDLVLDDEGRQVLGMSFRRGRLRKRRLFLSLHNVQAILRDRVVVTREPAASAPPRANGSLAGKAAVSRDGRYLGTVCNIYFDERTGAVSAYEVVRTHRRRGRYPSTVIPATARTAIRDVMVVDHVG